MVEALLVLDVVGVVVLEVVAVREGDVVRVVVAVVDGDVLALVVRELDAVVVCVSVAVVVGVVVGDAVRDVVAVVVGVVIWQSTNKPERCASIILFIVAAVASHDVSSRRKSRKQLASSAVPPGPVNCFTARLMANAVSEHAAAPPVLARATSLSSCRHCNLPCFDGQASKTLQQRNNPMGD